MSGVTRSGAFSKAKMIAIRGGVISLVFLNYGSGACPGRGHAMTKAEVIKLQSEIKALVSMRRSPAQSLDVPTLPDADSADPWGGAGRHWKPEAILANAASKALNQAFREADVADVTVAVPVHMLYTNFRIYCDGQTNASLEFGSSPPGDAAWGELEPQLVATLITYKNKTRKIRLWLDLKVVLKEDKFKLTGFVPKPDGSMKRFDVEVQAHQSDAGYTGEWAVPQDVKFGDLTSSRVLWIQPEGVSGVFPIDFRFPVVRQDDLLAASAVKTWRSGASLLDPQGIRIKAQSAKKIAELQLLSESWGVEWDQHTRGPYQPDSIHAEVDINGKTSATSTGKGWTWVANKSAKLGVPFKNLYTCFDHRNPSQEELLGVPSGGGWHEIGDAAETIINNLESSPLLVGMATGVPWPTPPDGRSFAWGLKDVAVIKFLRPGEALITPAGDQTWREDVSFRVQKAQNPDYCDQRTRAKGDGGGRNYHWFAFQFDVPVCTQEWVHNCVPSETNSLGLNCPAK